MSNSNSLSLFFIVLMTFLTGCATLTPSQVKTVNQYADMTTTYSAYPGKVLTDFITIRYMNRLLIASQMSDKDDPLTFGEINRLYQQKKREAEAAQGLDLGIQVINNYATALKKLSSPDFADNLSTNAQALGSSLDSLTYRYNAVVKPAVSLPFIGTLINLSLNEVGRKYIGYKQTTALKKYVLAGDKLVTALTKSLEETMTVHTTAYITDLEKDLGTFDNLLLRQLPKTAYYERYRFATETMATIERIDKLTEANHQSIIALQKLRTAHQELTVQLRNKQEIRHIGRELYSLYQAIQRLQATYQNTGK